MSSYPRTFPDTEPGAGAVFSGAEFLHVLPSASTNIISSATIETCVRICDISPKQMLISGGTSEAQFIESADGYYIEAADGEFVSSDNVISAEIHVDALMATNEATVGAIWDTGTGGTVTLPILTFTITAQIELTDNVVLEGRGRGTVWKGLPLDLLPKRQCSRP